MRTFTILFANNGQLVINKGIDVLDRFIDGKVMRCIYTGGIRDYIIIPDKYIDETVDNIKMEKTLETGIRVSDDYNADRVIFNIGRLSYECTEIAKPDIDEIDCPLNHKFISWSSSKCHKGTISCEFCETPIITTKHPMYNRIIGKYINDPSRGYSKEEHNIHLHLKDGKCKSVIPKITESKAIVPNFMYEIGIGDTLFFHIDNVFSNSIVSIGMTDAKKLSVTQSKIYKSGKIYHREE